MNVAVIGANGQLGSDVCSVLALAGHTVYPLTHQHIEIASSDSVEITLSSLAPDFIVNTAAAHHVDNCEADPAGSFIVNAVGARNLANFAAEADICLAHVSTDYVFDGEKRSPYLETDAPNPLNVYGASKLAGERSIQALAPRHFVLRVSGLYGNAPCRAKGGMNFVEKMLKLAQDGAHIRVVDDEFTTPTPTIDIARQLVVLMESTAYGLYHATAESSCSWYEFAQAIFDISGLHPSIESTAATDAPGKARRPKYSVLENAALKKHGLNVFNHWRIGLEKYISKRAMQRTATLAS